MFITDVFLGPIEVPANPYICLVDIDGTIANHGHRMHHLARPKDFNSFEAAMHLDTPIQEIIDVVKELKAKGWMIIGCTGRAERKRGVTAAWLTANNVPFDVLYMRGDSDRRPDFKTKGELIDNITYDFGAPTLALDDRDRVVKMIRGRGITCVQVAKEHIL